MKPTVKLFIYSLLICPAVLISQWSQIATINTPQLNAVKFFNEWTGITVGQGGIWRSTNSGVNWTQVLSGSNLNSVSFPEIGYGYAVGDSGKIFKSTDVGMSWFQVTSITSNNLYGVSFGTYSIGYVVGQNGIILRTGNGGTTWVSQYNPIPEDLYTVLTFTPSTVCAVGTNLHELYLSTGNSGLNWAWTIYAAGSLRGVANIGGYKIEVVGSNGMIRRSTNSGGTWTQIPSGTATVLNSILFPDTSTGFIAGNNGTILKSTNGGFNWSQQTSGTTNNLKAISFINTTTGWMVGQNGIVLRTGIPVASTGNPGLMPQEFKLYQNYPNPFNSETKIRLDIPTEGKINIELVSLDGKVLDLLVEQYLPAGKFFYIWSANNYSSGIYFVKVFFKNKVYAIKLLLIK